MHVTKLRPGVRAPEEADQIYIRRTSDGLMRWSGALTSNGSTVFGSDKCGHALVRTAEAKALAWAKRRGATDLVIEVDVSFAKMVR